MSRNLRVTFSLTPYDINSLVRLAMMGGFLREKPRGGWSQKELNDAARYAIQKLVEQKLEESR